ncbi:hypothetical protein Y032_0605g573 [Ancylostoma ceylanicum]|uniref:Uncharacterized protein n=1 Tax=Ancylostoma ceylanicum TaxID=53326 RepID=A0A016WLT8_9BILA|nr:hypothetical protein Y032_0605g573 [Ancylostoma ceylanicum]
MATDVRLTVLVKKIDRMCVRFLSVAAAESRRDLYDPLTFSMLSSHLSSRSRRNFAVTESVYPFEKNSRLFAVPTLAVLLPCRIAYAKL